MLPCYSNDEIDEGLHDLEALFQRVTLGGNHYEDSFQSNNNRRKILEEARAQAGLAMKMASLQLAQLDGAVDNSLQKRSQEMDVLTAEMEGLLSKKLAEQHLLNEKMLKQFLVELPFKRYPRDYNPAKAAGKQG